MKDKKTKKRAMKSIFEIALTKKNGVSYAICPQLGLVLDDEDMELAEYSMMAAIKRHVNDPERNKIYIPELDADMRSEFERVKKECCKSAVIRKKEQYLRLSSSIVDLNYC